VAGERKIQSPSHTVTADCGKGWGRTGCYFRHQCLTHFREFVSRRSIESSNFTQLGSYRKEPAVSGNNQWAVGSEQLDLPGQREHKLACQAIRSVLREQTKYADALVLLELKKIAQIWNVESQSGAARVDEDGSESGALFHPFRQTATVFFKQKSSYAKAFAD
jgi:hypothetical protein